ncbi:MAG: methionine synthase I, cobalamin-binding domain-containing protein [Candidatus Zixiibacteriota bacterium]|nr:MAG: methionine synthase I, cobalamin-binding domain-containing protein [candidate division Zixibacteria bacterium]
MPGPVTERLASGPPLLFDGALGSRLIALGLEAGRPPEAWVLDRPEVIEQVHREYAAAGSEVLASVTFGANRLRLRKAGLEERLEEINLRAVDLARRAAGDDAWVGGDMGPTGEFFQPLGPLTPAAADDVFAEQAAVLARAGVDFFLLETHYDLQEALANVRACRRVAPQIPVAATLTFNRTPRGFFTVMGDPAAEALTALFQAGCFLVGANCTLEAAGMLDLARHLTAHLNLPLLLQPNAGSPVVTPAGIVYPQPPDEFCRLVAAMIPLGVRAVGGCCGTDAEYLRRLREMLQ